MYRCGWATKEAQKCVLAIEIKRHHFEQILEGAVVSSYNKRTYPTQEEWKAALANSSVRLQWDPDHHPYGGKLDRRAIQLGLRGKTLRQFATDWIVSIEDITPFVLEQSEHIKSKRLEALIVAQEAVYPVQSEKARQAVRVMEWTAPL